MIFVKMKFAFITVLLFLSLVRSDGMIIPHHEEDPYPLILNHYVTVTINDTYAKTRVEQEFRNDGYRDLEGTYIFPVPGGGIRDVKLIVDGQTLEGRLLGSDEAKQTYEQYVLQRKDASLLEYVGRDAFSSSLVLPRGKTVKVVITYEQIIPSSGGLYSYTYPLSPERYSTKPIDPVNITVNINAPGNIGFIYSPTHSITVQRGGKGEAVATYYEEKVLPDKDFQLYYGVTGREYDVQLLTHKSDDIGYFLLFVYPSFVNQSPIPKDVVFVIDTSGSMEGTKIEQAKRALKYGLDKLNGSDRFNIIAFSTVTNRYSNALNGVSSIPTAKEFVDDIFAGGSTDLQDPLVDSITWFQNDSRVHIVVLLTDGRDTTGHSDAGIIWTLKETATYRAPIDFKLFVFGVGEDVDFELLDKLSNEFGDGIPTYIKSEADLEMTLKSFYDRIATPLLSNVQLTITPSSAPVVCETGSTGGCVITRVSAYDILPRRIPDVFLGTQIVVAGRYSSYGNATVSLKGTINGTEKEINYNVNFPQTFTNNFVERTWALRKVGYLLDQITLEGETEELKQQVTELATKYGIPTPYTSYLVISSEGNEVRRDLGIEVLPTAGGIFGTASAYKAAENTVQVASQTPETKVIGAKTFVSVGGIWKDTECGDKQPTKTISFGSAEYMGLLDNVQLVNYLSVGNSALLCSSGEVIKITPSVFVANTVGVPSQNETVPPSSSPQDLSALAIIPAGVILAFLALFTALNIMKRYSPQAEVDDIEVYRALSSDTRVGILNTLLEGERTPTDISTKLNKSKATIVEHLDKLREANLVEKIEVDGKKWVFYKLTPRGKSVIKKGG
ncbi:MAG: VIT domain-containing protein [Candidatus Micrarchaeota archaeon]|nr:VIT domain-containing protein [Candidatus Micrarchaeota archaeon]